MNLLIITQKVDRNDPVLGFFHRWLELFAKEVSELFVIAQQVGEYDLSANVSVCSLGKDCGVSKLGQLLKFWRLLFRVLPSADHVLVHMVPLWVALGAPLYLVFRKPVYLWYVHPRRDWLYRVSRAFLKKIFTPVRPAGFSDPKIVETGHGIDVELFKPVTSYRLPVSGYKLLTVGRISPVKRYLEMLRAIAVLKNEYRMNVRFDIFGGTVMPTDQDYQEKLKEFIVERALQEIVHFRGWAPPGEMPAAYQSADLLLNFTPSGSFDKAVLEAMAVNVPILVTNKLFQRIVPSDCFIDSTSDPHRVARKIRDLLEGGKRFKLRNIVEAYHNLYALIPRLIREMQ